LQRRPSTLASKGKENLFDGLLGVLHEDGGIVALFMPPVLMLVYHEVVRGRITSI